MTAVEGTTEFLTNMLSKALSQMIAERKSIHLAQVHKFGAQVYKFT